MVKKIITPSTPVTVANCNFVGQEATNEHTRTAVVALADAAKANADAINQIAQALKGPANNSIGLMIRQGSDE